MLYLLCCHLFAFTVPCRTPWVVILPQNRGKTGAKQGQINNNFIDHVAGKNYLLSFEVWQLSMLAISSFYLCQLAYRSFTGNRHIRIIRDIPYLAFVFTTATCPDVANHIMQRKFYSTRVAVITVCGYSRQAHMWCYW